MISRMRSVLETVLETISIALLALLSIIVIAGAAFRALNYSLIWYDEVASILLAWLTYYGASLAALKRAHIGFPGLVQALPPRTRRVVRVIAETFVFAFFALLAYLGWLVFQVSAGDTLSSLTWMPMRVAQSVIPIGALLFILAEAMSLATVRSGQTADVAKNIRDAAPSMALVDVASTLEATVFTKPAAVSTKPEVQPARGVDTTVTQKESPTL